ncbi:MAG: hypothetical protein J7K04_09085 [Spirochaetales bacterium]|nr:hypothetical protein [Spirochaetales bacterium]
MKNKSFFYRLFSNWPAKILSLAAAIIIFLFYRMNTMDERYFSVPLHVKVAQGYAVSQDYPKTVRVTLRGEGEKIYPILVEDITAYADLTRHKSEGVYKIPVKITKKGTAAVVESLEIKVEPQEIKFILERVIEKRVKVVPTLHGLPAHGYELGDFSVTPPTVVLKGPRSQVEKIKKVATKEINLSGRKEDYTTVVQLERQNPYINFVDENSVQFHATISEVVLLKTVDGIDLISIDLKSNLRLANPLPKGSIQIQGSQLLIESLRQSQFRLIVDCSKVETAGRENLPVKPEVPEGIIVLSYEPKEIALNFIEESATEKIEEIKKRGVKRE